MRKLAPLCLVAVIGLGCQASAQYGGTTTVTTRLDHGNGYVSPSVSRGATTAIGIHNYGGLFSQSLGILLFAPVGDSVTETSCASLDAYRDLCTSTTYRAPPTEEQMEHFIHNTIPNFLSRKTFVDTHLEIMSSALGDTGGWDARIYFTNQGMALGPFAFAYGYAYARRTHKEREWTRITSDGTTITTVDQEGEVEYKMFGIPIRLSYVSGNKLAFELNIDFNLLGIGSNQPTVTSLRAQYWLLPSVFIKPGLASSSFSPQTMSFSTEVGVAF